MKRRPITHRSAPAYPDRRGSRWAVGLLALGSALSSGVLVSCDNLPGFSNHGDGVHAIPGEMPAVLGDIEAPDPEVDPDPQADPSAQPVIPEVEAGPDVDVHGVDGDEPAPHPVPIPGGMRAPRDPTPVEIEPMMGEPPAPHPEVQDIEGDPPAAAEPPDAEDKGGG